MSKSTFKNILSKMKKVQKRPKSCKKSKASVKKNKDKHATEATEVHILQLPMNNTTSPVIVCAEELLQHDETNGYFPSIHQKDYSESPKHLQHHRKFSTVQVSDEISRVQTIEHKEVLVEKVMNYNQHDVLYRLNNDKNMMQLEHNGSFNSHNTSDDISDTYFKKDCPQVMSNQSCADKLFGNSDYSIYVNSKEIRERLYQLRQDKRIPCHQYTRQIQHGDPSSEEMRTFDNNNNNPPHIFLTSATIEPIPRRFFQKTSTKDLKVSEKDKCTQIYYSPVQIESIRKEIREQESIAVIQEEKPETESFKSKPQLDTVEYVELGDSLQSSTMKENSIYALYSENNELYKNEDSISNEIPFYRNLKLRNSILKKNFLNNNSPNNLNYEAEKVNSKALPDALRCFGVHDSLNNLDIKENSLYEVRSENNKLSEIVNGNPQVHIPFCRNLKLRNSILKKKFLHNNSNNNLTRKESGIEEKTLFPQSETTKVIPVNNPGNSTNGSISTLDLIDDFQNITLEHRSSTVANLCTNLPSQNCSSWKTENIAENKSAASNRVKHIQKLDLEESHKISGVDLDADNKVTKKDPLPSDANFSESRTFGVCHISNVSDRDTHYNLTTEEEETDLSKLVEEKPDDKLNSSSFKTKFKQGFDIELSRNFELYPEQEPNPSPDTSSVEFNRFIVNLFESRPSKRWQRRSVRQLEFHNVQMINDRLEKLSQISAPGVEVESPFQVEKDEMYYTMKKLRDIECVKMKEASSALFMIKNKVNRSWPEELCAESILLETHLRYKLIVHKIRESKDMDITPKQQILTGSVTLSNLQYELTPQDKKGDNSTFYLLAVSHDAELLTSKTIQAVDNRLNFNETFTFNDLGDDFKIKVEIYSIELNTSKRGIVDKLLKRKPKCCCPIKKIYYENVNTAELKESTILNSSFTPCADFSITSKDLGSSVFLTKKQQTSTGIFTNTFKATLKVNDINLKTKHEGFLTLGREDEENNIHYWERKWCCLNGNTFFIYNYPQDKEQDRPAAAKINLEYCSTPLVKNPSDCPRKRTFVLTTRRPRTLNDSSLVKHLDDRDNFILNKFYLSADNKEDFDTWNGLLDSALKHLVTWHKLVFKE